MISAREQNVVSALVDEMLEALALFLLGAEKRRDVASADADGYMSKMCINYSSRRTRQGPVRVYQAVPLI